MQLLEVYDKVRTQKQASKMQDQRTQVYADDLLPLMDDGQVPLRRAGLRLCQGGLLFGACGPTPCTSAPPGVGGMVGVPPHPLRDALEGGLPLNRRFEEVAKAVGGSYCRLQMPLRLALAARETVAGHRLGALETGGGG